MNISLSDPPVQLPLLPNILEPGQGAMVRLGVSHLSIENSLISRIFSGSPGFSRSWVRRLKSCTVSVPQFNSETSFSK